MRSHLLFPLLLCLAAFSGRTQTLEEVSFSVANTLCNTYVADINDAGAICGYYDSAGLTHGFAVNPDGAIHRYFAAAGQSIKVEGINDKGTLAATVTTGSTSVVYKAYYDSLAGDWGSLISMPGIAQPTAIGVGINNKNDIVGWYQGASHRYMWTWHDSITPSSATQWAARRYETASPTTYYNTQGTGINDNDQAVGFWYEGITITPVLINTAVNPITFTNITNLPATRTRIHDINNNQITCGEFRQANGVYMAFYAPVNASGMITQNHSLAPVFEDPTIQSVANGINNKGHIVGAYFHPATNTWVGFIFRPNLQEYRLPGYNWVKHTWNMVNTQAVSDPAKVWTSAYWGSNNYTTSDPFSPAQATPLLDPFLTAQYPGLAAQPTLNRKTADWTSFAQEVDTLGVAVSSPNYQVWKHWAFTKQKNAGHFKRFNGICYGFAFTSAIHYTDDAFLNTWYPSIGTGANLSSYTNTQTGPIRGITRTYLKQNDMGELYQYGISFAYNTGYWQGLFRLKNTYLETDPAKRNPRAIYISLLPANQPGYHSLFPYKIRTPDKFPFFWNNDWARDTMFVYDSNHPGDSLAYFTLLAPRMNITFDNCDYNRRSDLLHIHFNEAGAKDMKKVPFTAFKTTGLDDDTLEAVSAGTDNYFTLSSGAQQAYYSSAGVSNNIPWLHANNTKDTGEIVPNYYNMDTLKTVKGSSTNYMDGAMSWSLATQHRNMGISRTAVVSETDHGTFKHRAIYYGTHDAATKSVNGYFTEMGGSMSQGVNILVSGLSMANGDSILTENPSQFVYKITRIGGTATPYNLWIYQAGSDSMRQFIRNNVPLGPNSSHTITPYAGPGGTAVVILVDAGNNGTIDSTITLGSLSIGTGVRQNDFRIFPNPAHDMLSVQVPDAAGHYTISIADITGKIVLTSDPGSSTAGVMQVSLAGLVPGLYTVTVRDERGIDLYRGKFTKN